jgi:hypothetical protein
MMIAMLLVRPRGIRALGARMGRAPSRSSERFTRAAARVGAPYVLHIAIMTGFVISPSRSTSSSATADPLSLATPAFSASSAYAAAILARASAGRRGDVRIAALAGVRWIAIGF